MNTMIWNWTLMVGIGCGLFFGGGAARSQTNAAPDPMEQEVTQGALRVKQNDGVAECPLKHTDVRAEISGFIARIKVTQTFFNPADDKIEAVYVFPLPHEAAVDDLTMVIGDRRIVGLIKRRAEARQIYESALAQGATAALLEQERPNIFVQSVGNIPPKTEVRIEISYVDVLKYDQGSYEFHFPMVVGPRYNPAGFPGGIGAVPAGREGASGQKVEVPYLKPGERNGHDISLAVRLDAGVPIRDLKAVLHRAAIETDGPAKAAIALTGADTIPNKDFILKYSVLGPKPEMALLAHADGGKGYFMLMIQPKEDEKLKQEPPREIVFMIDVSGSQSGWPIEKSKEAMKGFLELMREKDTMQVVVFQSQADKLFEQPVPVTKDNIARALNFTQRLKGGGGTEMLKGVQMALSAPSDQQRLRVVIMFTDGFIGNEAQILEAIGKGCGDQIRFWCVGVGNSVNRFLVDGVAKQGGGMSKVLTLNEPAAPLVKEFMERIQRAQLAKIKIDWGGLAVSDTYPTRLPELWAGRPVIVYGLYDTKTAGRTVRLTVKGNVEGADVSWPVEVTVPAKAPENLALSRVWARQKIEDLMQQTYYAGSPEVEEAVTNLALDYRLMSQYTSFVAVDAKDAATAQTPACPPRRVMVAVPMPEGVSFAGVFGDVDAEAMDAKDSGVMYYMPGPSRLRKADAAIGGLYGGRSTGGRGSAPATRRMYGGPAAAAKASNAAPAPGIPAPVTIRAEKLSRAMGDAAEALEDADDSLYQEKAGMRGYLFRNLFAAQRQDMEARLKAELDQAAAARKQENWSAARSHFATACLLATAGGAADGRAAESLRALEEIDRKLAAAWAKELPGLNRKLNLVLRDRSLAEALAAVSQAAELAVELAPGSLEDARTLAPARDLRVTFLDLRGATAAQALDWILKPACLTWRVAGGKIAAGTVRRLAGESGWVYDVALLALPADKELAAQKDYAQQAKLVSDAAETFRKAVAGALALKDKGPLWFGPGELLIVGHEQVHAAALQLFTSLADPKAKLAGDLAALHTAAAARAQDGSTARAAALSAREKAGLYQAIPAFTWTLVGAAAEGKLNLEALTELQIVWQRADIADLVKDPRGGARLLASAWAIAEAAGALPGEKELAALAQSATGVVRQAAGDVLAGLEKAPQDRTAFVRALYAALVLKTDQAFVAQARDRFAKTGEQQPVGAALATALLGARTDMPVAALAAALANGVGGDDLVVLTAIACRRAGGETWDAFRAGARELLGGQPLSGGAVVFVNKLSSARLPLLAP